MTTQQTPRLTGTFTIISNNRGGPLAAPCAGACGRTISLAYAGGHVKDDRDPELGHDRLRWHPECFAAAGGMLRW